MMMASMLDIITRLTMMMVMVVTLYLMVRDYGAGDGRDRRRSVATKATLKEELK